MSYLKETYLNKPVQIYPGDSYSKQGIVRDITEQGVVFEITQTADNEAWPLGSLVFKSYSANLTFALLK